jgi:hypothetical protein
MSPVTGAAILDLGRTPSSAAAAAWLTVTADEPGKAAAVGCNDWLE